MQDDANPYAPPVHAGPVLRLSLQSTADEQAFGRPFHSPRFLATLVTGCFTLSFLGLLLCLGLLIWVRADLATNGWKDQVDLEGKDSLEVWLIPVSLAVLLFDLLGSCFFLVWQLRCSRNLLALHAKNQSFGPVLGIITWFIPIVLFIVPCLAIREIDRASDPAVPISTRAVRRKQGTSPVVGIWWLLLLACFLFTIYLIQARPPRPDTWENIIPHYDRTILRCLIEAAFLLASIALVNQITSNQIKKHNLLLKRHRTKSADCVLVDSPAPSPQGQVLILDDGRTLELPGLG